MRLVPRPSAFLLLAGALALGACVKERKKQDDEATNPEKPSGNDPVVAQKGAQAGTLDVNVEVRDDGILLKIGGIPQDPTVAMVCTLNETELDAKACHDGSLLARPANGTYTIKAKAMRGTVLVAMGASPEFTLAPGSAGDPDREDTAKLKVAIADDNAFKAGDPVPMTADLVVKLKLLQQPDCAAELQCNYDSRKGKFWTDCDAGGKTYTIKKDLVATGLQFLSVRAKCADKVGPAYVLAWYGVPQDYKPLQLLRSSDGKGKHFVQLYRDEDCPAGKNRVLQCAQDANAVFQACQENVFTNPPAGYRVRMKCDEAEGPVVTF